MATTAQRDAVLTLVGARSGATEDQEWAAAKYDEAEALVSGYCGEDIDAIPLAVLSQQVLEVAAKLYARKGSPNGVAQYDTYDGGPVPLPKDPMVSVYPVLDRFLPGGFA